MSPTKPTLIWPKLPTSVTSSGGPIRVNYETNLKVSGVKAWGCWDAGRRLITLARGARIETKWRILFHELTHAALDDSGISRVMTADVEEAICEAMSSARMAQMRADLNA